MNKTQSEAAPLSEVGSQPSPLSRFAALQSILCCPVTKGPLRLVGIDDLVSSLPADEIKRIPEGTVGAFISEKALRAYPLIGRVANLLEHDSLRVLGTFVDGGGPSEPAPSDDHFKWDVKDWYDRFGWKKVNQGLYNDTALFSQNWPEGHGLYEMMSHLSVLDRLPGGDAVIDAASGALAHTEYSAYSWFYRRRVCVDLSLTALKEADAKLREKDFCCLADICKLPFHDGVFDGAVSGYTIQHIPESQQYTAIQELYRVIKPGSHLCILTDVQPRRIHSAFFFLVRVLRKLLKVLRLVAYTPPRSAESADAQRPPGGLYSQLRDVSWWRESARNLTTSFSVEALRLLTKQEYEYLFGSSNRAAKVLRSFEDTFPHLASGLATCCLIGLRKP